MTESLQDSNLVKWKTISDQYFQKLFKKCKISWYLIATEVCSARVQMDTVVLEWEKYASTLATASVSGGTPIGKTHILKETTVLAMILKETNMPQNSIKKKIFFHWQCSCTWSFNCSQKAVFYIWHFFSFSLDGQGKAICSIYNKRVNTHKPGVCVGTSVFIFHLQVLQPTYSSDCSQNKIKSNREVTDTIRHCTSFYFSFFLLF